MSLSKFLSSKAGKIFFNVAYSWGACLVILGAVLKIMHIPPYDNWFLMAGMATEVFIFFISGFDIPKSELPWERVFPILADKNAKNNLPGMTAGLPADAQTMKSIQDQAAKLNEMYAHQIQQLQGIQKMNPESMARLSGEIDEMTELLGKLNAQYKQMLTAMNVKDTTK